MEYQSESLSLPEVTRIFVVTGLGRHGYVLACSIKTEDETVENLLHVCVADLVNPQKSDPSNTVIMDQDLV